MASEDIPPLAVPPARAGRVLLLGRMQPTTLDYRAYLCTCTRRCRACARHLPAWAA